MSRSPSHPTPIVLTTLDTAAPMTCAHCSQQFIAHPHRMWVTCTACSHELAITTCPVIKQSFTIPAVGVRQFLCLGCGRQHVLGGDKETASTPALLGGLVLLVLFAYGMVQLGMSSYDDPTNDRTPVHYAPSTDTDREVQREVQCLEAAYDRYERNPAAYPGYANELDYANALCDR